MPFDYTHYTLKCQNLSDADLQKEWDNYTRHISGASTATAVSILAAAPTFGISLINLAYAFPRIENARHKRAIIEATLVSRGKLHCTHKRDVLLPAALGAGLGAVTFGVVPVVAENISDAAAAGAVTLITANPHFVHGAAELVIDAVGDEIEHVDEEWKLVKESKKSR